jgi:hypothetical protein
MASGPGDSLCLSQDGTALTSSLPTDTSKPKVAVFCTDVQCLALITGQPLELARHVRSELARQLATSGNFAVVGKSSAASYVIEAKVMSFERGMRKGRAQRAAEHPILFELSSEKERREGLLELQVEVTDSVSGRLIDSLSATAQTEDTTAIKGTGLLGYAAIENNYQRRPDLEVISEACGKAALGLWHRLVNQRETASNNNDQTQNSER